METVSNRLRFVKSVFGKTKLANDGINVAVSCPACNKPSEKKKFSINLQTWQCHCWVCDLKSKTLLPVLKKFFSINDVNEYRDRFLNEKASGGIKTEPKKEEELKLPANFCLLADSTNSKDPDVRAVLSYLRKRGITERDLWYFRIGTSRSGRHRRRAIIPSFDKYGDLNYFSSRGIDSDSIKYINARANKRNVIFNDINIDWSKPLTIVEGPFDLISCNPNSTCILGSTLTEDYLLFRSIITNKTPVILCLDSDVIKKTFKIARRLEEYGCSVKIVSLPGDRDVGDLTKKEFLEIQKTAEPYDRNLDIKRRIRGLRSGSII